MLVAALALAACGSDSSSKDSGGSGSSSSSTTAAKKAAVILTKQNPDLGTILVDAQGRTVYTLTNGGKAVACTGACLTVWPPVKVASGDQVTSDGLPLYTFQGDTAPGMAKGENLSSFGGTWHVVKVGGGAASSSTTPTTAKSSSSTNSYGY
jgi:predicted lipoprotein with Yx(FWY)xxD motif